MPLPYTLLPVGWPHTLPTVAYMALRGTRVGLPTTAPYTAPYTARR